MWCEKFKCTMFTDSCIKRVNAILKGPYRLENVDSFNTCKECLKGKAVNANPDKYINRDVKRLIKKVEQENGKPKERNDDRKKKTGRTGISKHATAQGSSTGDQSNVSTPIRHRAKLKQRRSSRTTSNRRSKRHHLRNN